MKRTCTAGAIVMLLLAGAYSAQVYGAHSDIEFWYADGQIAVATNSGAGVAASELPTSGLFQQFDANPGFISETDVGRGLNPGDIVTYNVLDDLTFWDGNDFAELPDGVRIRIENNLGDDTIIDDSSGSQPGSASSSINVIDQAGNNGDFHSHVDYFLEPLPGATPPTPPYGAYGLKLSLSTDATEIADSDPFYILFNFGLGTGDFDIAVDAFAALLAVPLAPGDFNGDGVVDAADYTVWRDGYGQTEDGSVLSGNGDGGLVADSDYQLWQTHYGVQPDSVPISAAPEPATAALCLAAVAQLLTTTRRS